MSNILQRASQAIATFIVDKVDYRKIVAAYHKRASSGKNISWKRQSQNPSAKEIKDWKIALMSATDPDNPRRGNLMRFYQGLMTDLHLQACIENRLLPVQCAPFKLVDADNNEDTEAKKLLERPWYMKAVKLVTNHTFEGTKLLEMFELTEGGELKEITEIPQSNFIPSRGIILLDEYDTSGTSYKEGAYKDYYIQIGGDYNLGMLNMVAVIVIAKKLGLGSWMSYIERFGVPPLFAITNRMDDTRLEELFEMMENFRMNHFAVLQGEEKIDIPQGYNVDAHQTFNSLIDRANTEISKYINGGTGTTDEKSFVGSAEVHERLLKLRNSVDKLMFKFYFNQEIKPRLVKLSPVYAPLDKLTFEWDESENMTVKEIINAITSLSPYYEFDIKELERLTGLPFTQLKQMGLALPSKQEDVKKKTEANTPSGVKYAFATNSMVFRLPVSIDQQYLRDVQRIADDLYDNLKKPEELDKSLVVRIYEELNDVAKKSYGNGYDTDTITRKMREHLIEFAALKTNRLLSDIKNKKTEEITKTQFQKEAKKISEKQLGAWLKTEARNIARSAQMAAEWQDFERDRDIFPNLKYRTMQDSDVRDDHAINEGIIKPIDDWDAAPPFADNCRCYLEQTDEEPTRGRIVQGINPRFYNNPGKDGMVYSKEHPYYNVPLEIMDTIQEHYNNFKEFVPCHRIIEVGNNKIQVSDFADFKDLDENLIAAKKICKEINEDVTIRHHHSKNDMKNPDFLLHGKIGDLKTIRDESSNVQSFIKNRVKGACDQGCEVVILDFTRSKVTKTLPEEINRKLRGVLNNRNEEITELYLIYNNNVARLSRKEAFSGKSKKVVELFN